MTRIFPIALISVPLLLGTPAWAQEGHEGHHGASDTGAAGAQTDTSPSQMPMGGPKGQMPMGGMMGGKTGGMMGGGGMMGRPGQQGMMSMMGGGMMGHCAMMGMMADHVEGRLAFLKTELKITDEQMPKWTVFAETMRASATAMAGMRQSMMQGKQEQLPVRIDQNVKALSARLDAFKKVQAALEPLYASLSDEQKRTADQLIVSPMGMMGMM